MDFRREVAALLAQIPRGRVARCADVARGLGDVRASAAVFRFLREHPGCAGADRVVTAGGRAVVPRASRGRRKVPTGAPFTNFEGSSPLAELRAEQLRIGAKVSRRNGFRRIRTVGGVDLAYRGNRGFASLVVLRLPDLQIIEEVLVQGDVPFPYIPTYLAYREFPLIDTAFRRLSDPPTVLLVDGHGQLHPARCGIACVAGVKLDLPTIGVAKNPLVGSPLRGARVGEAVPISEGDRVLGYALGSSASRRPLYVSTGHRVAPRTAVRIVRSLCVGRLPEPLRLADAHAANWKRRTKEKGPKEVLNSLPPPRRERPKRGGRRA